MATLYCREDPTVRDEMREHWSGNEDNFVNDCTFLCECGCGERFMIELPDTWDKEIMMNYGITVADTHAQDWYAEQYDERTEHSTHYARNSAVVG